MAQGIDYSFGGGVTAAQIKGAGKVFVARYLDYLPNGKVINKTEADNLLKAGLAIVLVFESTANRMLGGHAAGVSDAKEADKQATALGMKGIPVYFACDFDATPGNQTPINAYLDGAASVIGKGRVGIYGGFWPVNRALSAGKATYAWQTYAWSAAGSVTPAHAVRVTSVAGHALSGPFLFDDRAQLRQGPGGKIGPASVDFDESEKSDYGQWPRPKVTPPSGPVRHQAQPGESISLWRYASQHGTTLAAIATLSKPELNAQNLAVFNAYMALDAALVAAGHSHPVMPDGLVYYTAK